MVWSITGLQKHPTEFHTNVIKEEHNVLFTSVLWQKCGQSKMSGLGWNFVPASQVSIPLQSDGHGIVGDEQEFVFLLGKRAFQPQKPCIFLLWKKDSSGQSVPSLDQ